MRLVKGGASHHFNPRSLHGERLRRPHAFCVLHNISIHAPCTGSDPKTSGKGERLGISIHAPCTGSDAVFMRFPPQIHISIHAPCTGSDALTICPVCNAVIFQSTLPARGATRATLREPGTASHFNPRSLHGERPNGREHGLFIEIFQSTLPARGATDARRNQAAKRRISIHAPCTGSDTRSDASPIDSLIISIHAPCTGSDYRRYRCTSSS